MKKAASFVASTLLLLVLFNGLSCFANEVAQILTVQDQAGKPVHSYSPMDLRNQFKQEILATETPWSKGEIITYRGPRLIDILQSDRLPITNLIAKASDDYTVTIEKSDLETYNPIVAIDIACSSNEPDCYNGIKPLDLEQGGPFYIVWPFKKFPQRDQDTKNSIWVWFAITVRPIQR